MAAGGSWAREKARVRRDTASCIQALKGSAYSPRQLDQVVKACIIPLFRYGAGMVDWTERELESMTAMWANARRLAWKLAPGTPHCLHTLHRLDGGGGIPSAKVIWAREMTGLWLACRKFDDNLRRLAVWEWENSVKWVGCTNDREASRELGAACHATKITDLSNRYRKVCAQLGTKVSWKHISINQASSHTDTQTLMQATRKARTDDSAMAESRMWDATPIELRIRRALKVLTRHEVIHVRALTLSSGRWIPFRDLPIPKQETGWSEQDYQTLCRIIDASTPMQERKWPDNVPLTGQQTLTTVPRAAGEMVIRKALPLLSTQHRVTADKMSRITGESDPHPDAQSHLCHFKPLSHAKGAWFPEQWRDDWELAIYMVRSAAMLPVRVGTPTRKWAMECAEAFRDEHGEACITMRAKTGMEDVAMRVSGYRGIRSYLPAKPISETATRPAERMFKSDCTHKQWETINQYRVTLQQAMERQRAGLTLTHGMGATTVAAQQLTSSGQQVMHSYGQTRPPLPFPTVGRMREVRQESAAPWNYHHRPNTVGDITFDTSTMVASPACEPQGTWTATSRHG